MGWGFGPADPDGDQIDLIEIAHGYGLAEGVDQPVPTFIFPAAGIEDERPAQTMAGPKPVGIVTA